MAYGMIQPAQARGALEGGPAVQRYDGRWWAGLVLAGADVE